MAPHILIVDADAGAATITGAWVQRVVPEATVVVERTVERGWRRVIEGPPDVLIIDPAPHTGDAELLIRLGRMARPALRVIVLASVPTPLLRRDLEHLAIDVYGEKPAALTLIDSALRACRMPQPYRCKTSQAAWSDEIGGNNV